MEAIIIDVSELAPPEPMVQILMALSHLQATQYLQVNHRREPFPLYEKLREAGWCYTCEQLAAEQFRIFIYHQENKQAFDEMKTACR